MHFRCSFGTIFARGAIQTVLAGGMLMWHGASDAATYVRLQKAPALTYTQFSGSDAKTLASLGVTLLDDYGPFAIGMANDGVDLAAASSSFGCRIIPEPDAYRVDGGGTIIDIREPANATANVPADLLLDDYPGSVGLYLVKFRGPIRSGWLDPLTTAGVRVIQYVHKDGYIVAAPGGLSALRALVTGPLIYVSVYQPYFKLAPDLRTGSALAGLATSTIRVTLDPDQDLEAIAAQLSAIDPRADIYIDRPKETAGAALSATPIQWRELARDPAVLALEPGTETGGPSDERVDQVIAVHRNPNGDGTPANPGGYKSWLSGLCMYNGHSLCGDLSTQLVDVMDSGIAASPYHPDLPSGRIQSYRLYCGLSYLNDDYFHGTFVAGLIGGDPPQPPGAGELDGQNFYYDTGVAPTVLLHPSRFMAQNGQFCTLTTGLLDTILSNAYTDGARFQNSSWYEAATAYGYTGIAREYDILVRSARLSSTTPEEQMTVVVAAGNNFSKTDPNLTVYSPATAKNVIAVGASAIQRGPLYGGTLGGNCDTSHTIWDLADFSRQAYAGDVNRFKPDIYAPGQNVSSARSPSMSSTAYSICAGQPPPQIYLPAGNGPNYPANGTSFSAPVVTGVAVLARQKIYADTADPQCGQSGKPACPNPSPALIKATLLSTTESNSLGGYNYYHNFSNVWEPTPYQGFGRVALSSLLNDPVSKAYVEEDHAAVPTRRFTQAGTYQNFTFTVADPSKAISAVLVYSDAPANVNANFVRVNEVDMYVMQGGYVYCDGQYGLQYATRSTACWLPDMSNNVKRARIAPNSFTGQFTIQVVGSSVAQHAVPGLDNGAPNQDWALYVYNAIKNF